MRFNQDNLQAGGVEQLLLSQPGHVAIGRQLLGPAASLGVRFDDSYNVVRRRFAINLQFGRVGVAGANLPDFDLRPWFLVGQR